MRDFLLTYANDIATLIGGLVGLGLNFVYARQWHALDKRPNRQRLPIATIVKLGIIFLVVGLILFLCTFLLDEGVNGFTFNPWSVSFFLTAFISGCGFAVLFFFLARWSLKRQEKI